MLVTMGLAMFPQKAPAPAAVLREPRAATPAAALAARAVTLAAALPQVLEALAKSGTSLALEHMPTLLHWLVGLKSLLLTFTLGVR